MTTQLVISKQGAAHWYFLAASPVQDGVENQCVVTALGISDDSPELPQRNMILGVSSETGLAILKRMLIQLPGNRGFKEVCSCG